MRIALLEDDPVQAELVKHWLADAGMDCMHFGTGAAFRKNVRQYAPDLVIIDWMLPDDDGIEVLTWLRQLLGNKLPVMFTTTKAAEGSLVFALEKGADDYLIKPLRREETIARIRVLARRGDVDLSANIIEVGGVVINRDKHLVTTNSVAVDLTEKELELAVYMLRNLGRLLSRQELLENVWRTNPGVVTRTVDTHVSRLRSKLGLMPENGFVLTTVYHKGYRLEYRTPENDDSIK